MSFFEMDVQSLVVIVNAALVGLVLVLAGRWLASGGLSVEHPTRRQNAGEAILQFFVGKARDMSRGPDRDRVTRIVAPLLASFFLFIFVCNLVGMLPLPIVNRPPTSHFSVTLGLAISSVVATLLVSARLRGAGATVKHLFWPNPMQWVSEITDVLSLSLRLFGNIGGEFMTLTLVLGIVPYGIPLVLHVLGLIPAFVQGLVFTLLTSSFIANAIHEQAKKDKKKTAPAAAAVESPVARQVGEMEGSASS